jgi:hypothetical protein
MRVDSHIAVTGKMFGGRERAMVLHAAHEFRDKVGYAMRIFAERADVDDRVVGIVVEVRIGRENPIDAGGARLERGDPAGLIRKFGIARRTDRHRRRERRAFVDSHARAGFKVSTDEQRNTREALKLVNKDRGGEELAADNTEWAARGGDDDAADVVALHLGKDFFSVGGVGRRKPADALDHEHLAELFA